ncbi:MAG: hypothetical protein JO323_23155 [Acidobacteriia bacterium]|nr:hypothetical protein [Terriglobia bacterium]
MSTQLQIDANRLNSQKSTGPVTSEGKTRSSQNALKSGLDSESLFIRGEDPEQFRQLQNEYADRFQPATPDERFQLDLILRNEWLLRRVMRVEAQLWNFYTAQSSTESEQVALGEAFAKASSIFMRLQRRTAQLERGYQEAYAELMRLQAERQEAENIAEPADLASFLTSARTNPVRPSALVATHTVPPGRDHANLALRL